MIGKHKNIINLLGACTQDGTFLKQTAVELWVKLVRRMLSLGLFVPIDILRCPCFLLSPIEVLLKAKEVNSASNLEKHLHEKTSQVELYGWKFPRELLKFPTL